MIKKCKKIKKFYRCEFNIHTSYDLSIILGEPFFRNYLVTFDIDNYKIGFTNNTSNDELLNNDKYLNALIDSSNRFF